jgi:hypothetical protein
MQLGLKRPAVFKLPSDGVLKPQLLARILENPLNFGAAEIDLLFKRRFICA